MRKHATGILLLLAVPLLGCYNRDEAAATMDSPKRSATHEEAAKSALQLLSEAVTAENAAAFGFRSREDVAQAELGRPVPLKVLGYDKLLKYQPGTPLAQLLDPIEQVVYPIRINGALRSSAVVTRGEGGWSVSSLADAHYASILEGHLDQPGLQIISAPGLNLEFLGFEQGGQLLLVPTADFPELKLPRGRAIPAESFLPAISSYAKQFDAKYGDAIRRRRLVN